MFIVARFLTTKAFFTPTLCFETFLKVKTLCTRSYRNENHYKNTFSKSLSKTHSTNTSLNYFSKYHFVRVLIETRTITKTFSKYIQKLHHKHIFKQKQVIQQATKILQITTDEKDANTSPFHNLPPELKKIIKRSFLIFSPFPLLDKRKIGGDSFYPQQLR